MSDQTFPRCGGMGRVRGQVAGAGGARNRWACGTCLATGSVATERIAAIREGCRQRRKRLSRGHSMGERAARLGISVVALSRLEAGLPV